MLRAFTVGFERVLKSFLLLLATLPGLIVTLLQVACWMVSAMTEYDVATRVFDTELLLQQNIGDLISGITFIVLFSQEKPL